MIPIIGWITALALINTIVVLLIRAREYETSGSKWPIGWTILYLIPPIGLTVILIIILTFSLIQLWIAGSLLILSIIRHRR